MSDMSASKDTEDKAVPKEEDDDDIVPWSSKYGDDDHVLDEGFKEEAVLMPGNRLRLLSSSNLLFSIHASLFSLSYRLLS